jgi:hypothetical protein
VAPGTIATELAQGAVLTSEEAKARIMSRTPMKRLGEPSEIADVCRVPRQQRGQLHDRRDRLHRRRAHDAELHRAGVNPTQEAAMTRCNAPPLTGGCLCGTHRYEARPRKREGYYCHCRMCQLAFGNTRAASSTCAGRGQWRPRRRRPTPRRRSRAAASAAAAARR